MEWLTIQETADLLRVSVQNIKHLRSKRYHHLKTIKLDGKACNQRLFDRRQVEVAAKLRRTGITVPAAIKAAVGLCDERFVEPCACGRSVADLLRLGSSR